MYTRRRANLGAKQPKYLKVFCTYNVTNTSSNTRVCNNTTSLLSMTVDGMSKAIATGYTFDTLGEHFVEFNLIGDTVGTYAFNRCYNLTNVEFEEGIKRIDDYAFNTCTGLTCELVFPDSMESIGLYAFNLCYCITALTMNNGLLTIGSYAFNECKKISNDLVIPDSVTSIGNYAFKYVYRIKSLTLGENLTSIGDYAFYGCYYIESIIFPNKLRSIGSYAFTGCKYLYGDLIIPDSVTSIGSYAFNGCCNLTSLKLSENISIIEQCTFLNCTDLNGTIIIPDSVTTIGSNAFAGCINIDNIEFGDYLSQINSYAFTGCTGITTIHFPSRLTSIGNYAFSGCTNLSTITCDATTPPTLGANTFQGVKTYGRLIYPELIDYSSWLSESQYYLGYYCWNEEYPRIYAKYDVTDTTVSTKLLYDSSYIKQMFIDGEEVPVTNSYEFKTKGIHTVEYVSNSCTTVQNQYSDCTNLVEIEFGEGFKTFADNVCYSCYNLQTIKLPSTLRSLSGPLFSYCTGLTELDLSLTSISNLKSRITSAVDNLEILKLPSTLTNVSSYAFDSILSLHEITCNATIAPTFTGSPSNMHHYGTLIYPEGSDYSSWLSTLSAFHWNEEGGLLKVTYNITDISKPTQLYSYSTMTGFTLTMYVDGETKRLTNQYQFDTIGEHLVEYRIKQNVVDFYGTSLFGSDCPIIGIEIPRKLTKIANGGNFINSSLTLDFIKVASTNTKYDSRNNCNCLIDSTTNAILQGANNAFIPSGITSIYHSAFANCTLSQGDVVLDLVTSIGASAFTNCSNLTSVVIGDSCTSIGSYAFSGCKDLTGELVIPDSVKTIGTSAFSGCTKLTGDLIIPDSVTSIGETAFSGCTGLKSVVIGSGVTSIGRDTFSYCTGLKSVVIGDSCTSIGTSAFIRCVSLTSVVIGSGVTSISSEGFYNCSSLFEITCKATTAPTLGSITFNFVGTYGTLTYPEGSDYSSWLSTSSGYLGYYKWNDTTPYATVKAYITVNDENEEHKLIGSTSFLRKMLVNGKRQSFNYNKLDLGLNVIEYHLTGTTIGKYTFSGCTFEQVELNDVTNIQTYGFYNCNKLENLVIPSSVTTLEDSWCYFCDKLSAITFESGITKLVGIAYCPNLTEINIPDSVTSMVGSFQNCDNLASIIIPDSVTGMTNAFIACNNLTSITVPSGVTTARPIQEDCENLKEVIFLPMVAPDYTTRNAYNSPTAYPIHHYIPYGADYNSFLTGTFQTRTNYYTFNVLGGNPQNIDLSLDGYDLAVVIDLFGPGEILLQQNSYVHWVSKMAIDGVELDTPVTKYNFPDGGFGHKHTVHYNFTGTSIPHYMFGTDNNGGYDSISISEVIISNRLKGLGANTFNGCKNLKKISIGSGVTDLGVSISNGGWQGTFSFCHSLETIIIDPLNPKYDSRDNSNCIIETATNTLLLGCKGTIIPDSVTSIGATAFAYCASLPSVVIPDSVTSIGASAFTSCYSLTSVEIGSGVTSIGERAFTNCSGLTSVEIGSSVTSISNYAFSGCTNLTSIDIPDSVTSIGASAFTSCYGLSSVEIGSGVTSIGRETFSYCTGLTEIIIPDSVTSIGASAFSSCKGLTSVIIGSGVTSIGASAFTYCYGLSSLEIGDGCTSIGDYAFHSCTGLTEIIIPDSVTSIGDYAFSGCTGLTSVIIGSGVISIGSGAFSYCTGLTSVIIGSGVTSIGERAFSSCRNLTSIVIPDSVTSIGASAFTYCTGLTSVIIGSGVTSIGASVFYNCQKLKNITCKATTAPTISSTFNSVRYYGTLTYPEGSDYSSWLSTNSGCLGYYGWNNTKPKYKINITRNATKEKLEDVSYEYTYFYKGLIVGLEIDGVEQDVLTTRSILAGEHVFTVYLPSPTIPDDAYDGLSIYFITYLETNFEPTYIGTNNHFYRLKNGFKLGNYISTQYSVEIPPSVTYIGSYFFPNTCFKIISYATTAPSIGSSTFNSLSSVYYGTLTYPEGSDYSSWLSNNSGYLGYNGWNQNIEKPKITLTYYVKDISQPSFLYSGYTKNYCKQYFQTLYVDGVEHPVVDSLYFDTKGRHIVECVLYKKTIPRLDYCTASEMELPSHPDFTSITNKITHYAKISAITIGYYYTSVTKYMTYYGTKLRKITCLPPIAPTVSTSVFNSSYTLTYGTLIYPEGSDYSTWLTASSHLHWNEETAMLIAKYNVTSTTIETILFLSTYDVKEMYIDDVKVEPTTSYKFSTLGIHEVKFKIYSPTTLENTLFYDSTYKNNITSLVEIEIPDTIASIKDYAFYGCNNLKKITCHTTSAPSIGQYTFYGLPIQGTLIYPEGSDYSSWLNTRGHYLGYYYWNQPIGIVKITYNITDTDIPVKICDITSGFTSISIDGEKIPITTHYLFDSTGEHIVEFTLTGDTIFTSAFTGCYEIKNIEFNECVSKIGTYAFNRCYGLSRELIIPNSIKTIGDNAFQFCRAIKELYFKGSPSIGSSAFSGCTGLQKITCESMTAPTVSSYAFQDICYYGDFYHSPGTGYENWYNTNYYYLGYYKWNFYELYKPLTYYGLTITANDVSGRDTNTVITWKYYSDGFNPVTNEPVTGVEYTGTTVSDEFPQNTSETNTVERVITFEIMGMTASTTIIQGVWINQTYTIDLNNQWEKSTTISNPDAIVYDGVYQSFSNKGVDNSAAIMYIDIVGYETFKLYIRSYAESYYDFVVVSNLDCTLTSGTTSGTNVKATTNGNQNSGTAISNYTLVEFTGIDGGEHRISVMYRKDISNSSGDDRGYLLIPKNQ